MEEPHNSGRCCDLPVFKRLELLLATIKPYRPKSIRTHTQYWPVLFLQTNCYTTLLRAPTAFPGGMILPPSSCYETRQLRRCREKKAKMIPNSARTGNFCLAHARNHSWLLYSALHQHGVGSGNNKFGQKLKPAWR